MAKHPTAGFWLRLGRPLLQTGLLVAVLLATLAFQLAPGAVDLNAGEVSPRTIKSPRKVTYVSRIVTDAERERASAGVPDVLDYDPTIAGVQLGRLRDMLERIDRVRAGAGSPEQKREALSKLPDLELSAVAVDALVGFDDISMRAAAEEAVRLLDDAQRPRLNAKDLAAVRDSLDERANPALTPAERTVAVELTRAFLRPNLAVNEAATTRNRRDAREAVKPVEVTVEQGETILRDGEVVKPTDVEKLAAVGLRTAVFDWLGLAGQGMLIAALVALAAVYIRTFLPQVWSSPRQLMLVYLLIAFTAVAVKLVAPGRPFLVYALPIAAVPMLLTTLIDPRAALMSTLVLAVFLGLVGSNPFELAALTLVGGAAGIIGVWRCDRVTGFIRAGLLVGVADFVVIAAFRLIGHDVGWQDMALLVGTTLANGLLAAFLTLGTVTVLGHLFGLTTMFGLLELAHPTQPLFQRLLHEAPGTYHHSMMIANLGERAAQSIGADALLCRVGAYYHDIGKILRPYFYIENQLNMPNIHNRLDPSTSSRIIASHVTDGVRLAREYGLPVRVIDMIEQHHGTRFVGPFYFQACQASPNNPPPEAEFRYTGPRPQTKEAAIMMLADSVEAAVRASKDQTAEKIEAIVTKIIGDRVQEGELDDCDVTLRDLSMIKAAFLAVLQGVFHPRIEYPDSVRPTGRRPGDSPVQAVPDPSDDTPPVPVPVPVAAARQSDGGAGTIVALTPPGQGAVTADPNDSGPAALPNNVVQLPTVGGEARA